MNIQDHLDFVLEMEVATVYLSRDRISVYKKDDLVLMHFPTATAENNDAYNLAMLWGKVSKKIQDRISSELDNLLEELNKIK